MVYSIIADGDRCFRFVTTPFSDVCLMLVASESVGL